MAETTTVDVGQPAAPSAPGLLQNPRILLIGGGALVVALIIWFARRSGAPASSSDDDSQVAGPNAALAIGSLESRLQERTGRLEETLAAIASGQSDTEGLISGLQDSQASALARLYATVVQGQGADSREAHEIRTAINSMISPGDAQTYRDMQNAFEQHSQQSTLDLIRSWPGMEGFEG